MTDTPNVIEIKLSSPIEPVLSKSPLAFRKECLSQVNMCWYKFHRSATDTDLPTVIINSSLAIDHVTDFNVSIDGDMGSNIEDIDLMIRGLPDNSLHSENQEIIYSLIKKIKTSGWTHYYSPYDPRISGAQSEKITAPRNIFGVYANSHPWFDPGYRMNMDRWLKVDGFYHWNFYRGGNYLTLSAWRRDSDTAPKERGTYLISLKFLTEREYWMADFTGESAKARWTELLPDLLLKYKKQRDDLEAKAKAAGIEIDSNYKDPVIQAIN